MNYQHLLCQTFLVLWREDTEQVRLDFGVLDTIHYCEPCKLEPEGAAQLAQMKEERLAEPAVNHSLCRMLAVKEFPTRGPHRAERISSIGLGIELGQGARQLFPNLEHRLHDLILDLEVIWVVEHAPILQESEEILDDLPIGVGRRPRDAEYWARHASELEPQSARRPQPLRTTLLPVSSHGYECFDRQPAFSCSMGQAVGEASR